VATLAGGFALASFAQERPESKLGHYAPMQPSPGVLDTASGALYYVDPASPNEVVTLDLPGCRAFVRDVAKDASGWGAVDLPKLDTAVVAARERTFVVAGPFEVLDTRSGALYQLETPPSGRAADWKNVKVVRTDPVLGTRTTRELHVSKRGS
jgi:hypothetical protein